MLRLKWFIVIDVEFVVLAFHVIKITIPILYD